MDFGDFSGEIPVITPGSTSYFSAPASELDPKLFQGEELNHWVRMGILSILFEYLGRNFDAPGLWTQAWLAGSGVSYQWQAARTPGDLDCLVGINYVIFRQHNQEFAGFSDEEIAKTLNDGFNSDIMPDTKNWEGYELTYYVNPQSDIRDINPYAAYDLTNDRWTVRPEQSPQAPYSRAWENHAQRDKDTAEEMVKRYTDALNEVRRSTNPAYKVNAERKLRLAMEQAAALYDDIHANRKIAFSRVGSGYADYNNYRWQAGKRSGAIQALRTIKDNLTRFNSGQQKELYGIELPNTDILIRRTLRGK
jgi:hypothetical protein